nr:hypothetical protein [Candidatus Levybacteria bacterium]
MATEALRAPGTPDGKTPRTFRPNHADIPLHLIKGSDGLGMERAKFTEERVQNIIASQTEIIESVIRNEPFGEEDSMGHDLTVILNGKSPLRVVYVQVKSSRSGIIDYKQWIRDKFFPNNPNSTELVKKWMTEHGIILLNGSETKTDAEILESFNPQLERIQRLVKRRQNTESSGQMKLFTNTGLTQIFPEAV